MKAATVEAHANRIFQSSERALNQLGIYAASDRLMFWQILYERIGVKIGDTTPGGNQR